MDYLYDTYHTPPPIKSVKFIKKLIKIGAFYKSRRPALDAKTSLTVQ
jgi:hypothetical protein